MENMRLVIVLLEGIISFFSPCIIPVLPVYLSILSNSSSDSNDSFEGGFVKSTIFKNTLCFVFGISTTFFILGLSVQSLSHLLTQYQTLITLIGGLIIMMMGLVYLGLIQVNFLSRERRMQIETQKMNAFSAYLLGFTFSFGWTPCVGPMLTSVLIMALGSESAATGNLLIVIYTMGFVIPFILMALFYNRMIRVLSIIKKNLKMIKVLGGVILLLSGGAMVFNSGVQLLNTPSQSTNKPSQQSEESGLDKEEIIKAPDFTLNDQYALEHILSQYEGKVIYLTFFATWCPNCGRELPSLDSLYKEYGENQEDVVILGVASPNIGREGDETYIKTYLEERGYTFPVAMDHEGNIAYQYSVRAVPTSYVIDREGNIKYYIPGAIGEQSIRQVIEEVVAE